MILFSSFLQYNSKTILGLIFLVHVFLDADDFSNNVLNHQLLTFSLYASELSPARNILVNDDQLMHCIMVTLSLLYVSRMWRHIYLFISISISRGICGCGGALFEGVMRTRMFYIYSQLMTQELICMSVIQQQQIIINMKPNLKLATLLLLSTALIVLQNYHSYNQNEQNWQLFTKWADLHGHKFHDQQETLYRFGIFKMNKKKVEQHNLLAKLGKSTYYMGLNRFASLTEKQFKQKFTQIKPEVRQNILANITTKCTGNIEDSPNPPTDVNWTEKAVDKNVIIQGSCAGNYAFSAVAALEGLITIKLQKTIKLSDQQVLDCSGDYGNQGCSGGFMDQAYWYMIDNGMASVQTYPYVGKTQNCKYTQAQKVVKVGRCARVPSGIYLKLISAVIQQPVSVAVSSQKFMLYERGIFDGDCNHEVDRGMLLVGYGAEQQHEFWLLKNSLGVSWGEKGYMKLKRTQEDGPGMCGIQLAASIPQNAQ